jgi:hypothetical protein
VQSSCDGIEDIEALPSELRRSTTRAYTVLIISTFFNKKIQIIVLEINHRSDSQISIAQGSMHIGNR